MCNSGQYMGTVWKTCCAGAGKIIDNADTMEVRQKRATPVNAAYKFWEDPCEKF